MTSSLLRSSSALALVVAAALTLGGCSLLSPDSGGPPRTGRFEARDLDGFFDVDNAPSAFALDLNFSTIGGSARVNEVAGFWDDGARNGDGCFDSYAASFLVDDSGRSDEFAYIAIGESRDTSSYSSIDGRVFADTASAAAFFDILSDAAAECTAAGGYEFYADDVQVWGADSVSVVEPDDLELPAGISAIYQQEEVDGEFATGYRVYMLQRDNLIVAITVQPGVGGGFDFADGDRLVEAVAAALGGLR